LHAVQPTEAQKLKLKRLHWDAVRTADGTIWHDVGQSTELDLGELERLFKLLDNQALQYARLALLPYFVAAQNACRRVSDVHMSLRCDDFCFGCRVLRKAMALVCQVN
jgi:hypothetical protein